MCGIGGAFNLSKNNKKLSNAKIFNVLKKII